MQAGRVSPRLGCRPNSVGEVRGKRPKEDLLWDGTDNPTVGFAIRRLISEAFTVKMSVGIKGGVVGMIYLVVLQ